MSRILVTGSAGYIGSTLCKYLIDAGHKVVALDNFRHGIPSLNYLCAEPRFTLVRGDCRDENTLKSLLKAADAVIPLAALVGVAECERDTFAAQSTNADAIKLLIRVRSKSQRVLYPNTNSGYGTSGEEICTEESELKPISLYGRTKCEAERAVVDAGNFTVFRLATVFGMSPRMRWDLMVSDFVLRAVRDKAMVLFEPYYRRNFVHVRDVARAFVWALVDNGDANDQVFNLGLDDANLTKAGLCERIKKHVPEFTWSTAEHMKDIDARNYYVSNERIGRAGFSPIHSLDQGIDELIKGAQQYL